MSTSNATTTKQIPKRGFWDKYGRNAVLNLCFLGPCYILFTVFFINPMIQSIYFSFTNWNAIDPSFSMVGLQNYINIFTVDTGFLPALGRTFFFAFFNVLFTNVLAMLFGVALTTKFRFNNMFRSAIFIPNVIAMVVTGFIWQFMFLNVFPTVAETMPIPFGFLDISWLSDPSIVMFSVVIVSVWQGVGYIMTIYIAGLVTVDESMLEAATIDGASGWTTFWRIKLPAILPTVGVGAFLNVAGSFKIFDIVYALTSGGPGESSTVAMLDIFREAYMFRNFGYASAKAVILSIIIILITLIQFKITSKSEVD